MLHDRVQRAVRWGCLAVAAVGLVLGMAAAVWCRPVRVERQLSCVRLSEEGGEPAAVTVRIQGALRRRPREFSGGIELEGYPYTQGYTFRPPLQLLAQQEDWLLFPFTYWEYPDGVPQCRLSGQLLADPDFQRVVLLVQQEGENVSYAIAGPAADREEAMQLYQEGRRAWEEMVLAL